MLAAACFLRHRGRTTIRGAATCRTSVAMPNTPSARKATRKIARRTEINKARRSQMRSFLRQVEEAITAGDRNTALAALKEAEPVIMRAAQKGVVHPNAASRKVSRLAHRVAKLAT
jgi:small subunit ribosomal protein S20